jgi:hypothetical protein
MRLREFMGMQQAINEMNAAISKCIGEYPTERKTCGGGIPSLLMEQLTFAVSHPGVNYHGRIVSG